MFVERLNSKNVFAVPELCEKCAAKSGVFTSLPQITSHKPLLVEISNINIFHITQYFWVKSYKRNQCNLPNILAYTLGIFDDFQSWVSPLKHVYSASMWSLGLAASTSAR